MSTPYMILMAILFIFSGSIENASLYTNGDHSKQNSKDPKISITFAGDTMMDWSVKKTIQEKGEDYPFQEVKEEITKSDYAIVNLETAVTKRTKTFNKQYNFKSDPKSIEGLKNAGFDLISLANNHTMDYQVEGLLDTMKSIDEYGLSYMGAGVNATEAYQAKEVMIKGKSIKFLAFSRVLPSVSWKADTNTPGIADGYNLNLIKNIISKESKTCDYLFVYMHWGTEKRKRPEEYQVQYAKTMIDAGADAIIGSHPHVLQGFQYYKGKPIAYSLGNFLFPDYVSDDSAETGLLTINIKQGKFSMKFTPYHIVDDRIITVSLQEKERILSKLEDLSYQISLTGDVFQAQ